MGGGKDKTIGAKFRAQLSVLADALDEGESLFVRCIKSNSQKVPNLVDRQMVLEQLTLGGVVAALEVRAAGLPDRLPYEEFAKQFKGLACGKQEKVDAMAPKVLCEEIMKT